MTICARALGLVFVLDSRACMPWQVQVSLLIRLSTSVIEGDVLAAIAAQQFTVSGMFLCVGSWEFSCVPVVAQLEHFCCETSP